MSEKREESVYPVRTLHDFLFEIDREWSKFRNGALVTLISSGIMFVFVVWLIVMLRRITHPTFLDLFFLIGAGVLLAYSIYSTYSQYSFFSKWERRIGLLLHLEEQIAAEKLGDKAGA